MQFALLSADEDAIQLATTLSRMTNHRMMAAYGCEPFSDQLSTIGIPMSSQLELDDWVRLQHEPDCDAAIVGRAADEEARAEHLRKLVQSGLPLIVIHPICDMLLSFELQMIQRDSGSAIVPYFPGLYDGAVKTLTSLVASGATASGGSSDKAETATGPGTLQQITIERDAKDGSRDAVREAFARDALLARRLVGKIGRIGALGAMPYPSDDWRNMSIHMNAENGAIIRWTASPVAGSGELTVAGDKGKVVFHSDFTTGEWDPDNSTSTIQLPANSDNSSTDSHTPLISALEEFENNPAAANDLWEDACRAVELADTVDHSYRRGKTIELYHEEHTEEETFKSMMAAGGCLALMLTLMIIPFFAMLESLQIPWLEGEAWHRFPLSLLYWRKWPYYLLGALTLFLTLQFLRLVFKPTPREAAEK